MELYRKDPLKRDWGKLFGKVVETSIKAFVLLILPALATMLVCAVWYLVIYGNAYYFNIDLEDKIITSWISMIGILYSLLAIVVIDRAFNKYGKIRIAIKSDDVKTFMLLRDEDTSPIMHIFMTVLAIAVLGIFMGLSYPNIASGLIVIGGTTYIFSLLFWIIREVDEPLSGMWFIKSMPEGWLETDPRKWRDANIPRKPMHNIEKEESMTEAS